MLVATDVVKGYTLREKTKLSVMDTILKETCLLLLSYHSLAVNVLSGPVAQPVRALC